jgi:hypothetical protein
VEPRTSPSRPREPNGARYAAIFRVISSLL